MRDSRLAIFVVLLLLAGCRGAGDPAGRVVDRPPGGADREKLRTAEPPDEVGFLHVSDSYEELLAAVRPDLSWRDPDHLPMFLWMKPLAKDRWSIVMDRAYRFRRDGKVRWGLLDFSARDGWSRQTPRNRENKFYRQKLFAREEINYPSEHHDPNHSFAELLARRDDGAAVFKIVYCSSTDGGHIHQEDVRTYLVSWSPDGVPLLAANELTFEAGRKSGWTGTNHSCDIKVVWTPGKAVPFRARLREKRFWWAERGELPFYDEFRDGTLSGPFPMRLRMSDERYALGDGKTSLDALVETMIGYHFIQSSASSSWATPEDVAEGRSLWRAKLRRLNPGREPGEPVAKGERIALPADIYQFKRSVWGTVHRSHREREKKSGVAGEVTK